MIRNELTYTKNDSMLPHFIIKITSTSVDFYFTLRQTDIKIESILNIFRHSHEDIEKT